MEDPRFTRRRFDANTQKYQECVNIIESNWGVPVAQVAVPGSDVVWVIPSTVFHEQLQTLKDHAAVLDYVKHEATRKAAISTSRDALISVATPYLRNPVVITQYSYNDHQAVVDSFYVIESTG